MIIVNFSQAMEFVTVVCGLMFTWMSIFLLDRNRYLIVNNQVINL